MAAGEAIRVAAKIIGIFFMPVALLWHFVWKEKLLDRVCVWRLRVARRVRRAEYIRWWRFNGSR